MVSFWFYDGAFAPPSSSAAFEDTDAEWREALCEVEVCAPSAKLKSPAVCSGEFKPGTNDKHQHVNNLLASHGLVLDVDVWHRDGHEDVTPFTADDLRERLEGFRFIAWTTFSSMPEMRKWRVVIPFDSPMPTSKYAALWHKVNEILDFTMGEGTKDPARLGFFRTVNSEAAKAYYEWFINPGERLDWTQFDLEDVEVGMPRALVPADLSSSPDWSTPEAAKERAKKYYRVVGRDVDVGSRHETLLRAACRLWWDWAAPSEQWVFDVLNIINNNFVEPKDEVEVWKEVRAGHDRTLGPNRVEQPTTYGAEREPETRATKTGILERGKSLLRQAREEDRVKGRALKAVGHGESFAEPIEARKVANDVAAELAQLYSREQPERLLALMQTSLDAQRERSSTHPIPTNEEILSRIRWKQKEIRNRADDREKVKNDDLKRAILKAFNGQRDAPYSQKEYRDFEATGFNDDQWILQRDKSYYFFVGGEYRGPYIKEVAENFSRVFLAPAYDRLKLSFVNKAGQVTDRKLDELVKNYGTYLEGVEHCSYASQCTYVEAEKKLIVPVKLRVTQGEYVPQVAQFLACLGGEKHDQLLTWLAAVTSTDRELAALMLVTDRNQGKGLLANGISRLWREAGVPALRDYTPMLYESCALFLCDEMLPQTWLKKPTAMLRQALSESSREVKRPYIPPYAVSGYPRIIFAANNLALFKIVEEFEAEDELAVSDRLLLIDRRRNHEAEKYLKSLGSFHRQFVSGDLIAKHILHLRDTIPLPTERFVVAGADANETQNMFYANNDKFLALFDWIVNYLVQGMYQHDAVLMDVDDPGSLYVNAGLLLRQWSNSGIDKKGINASTLGRVLKVVCSPGRRHYWNPKTKVVSWYRPLNLQLFEQWLTETANVEVNDIHEILTAFAAKKSVKFGALQGGEDDEVEG